MALSETASSPNGVAAPHPVNTPAVPAEALRDALPDLGLAVPDAYKDRYARLALVSAPMHVDTLGNYDDDLLVVSFDWLLWRQCRDRNIACLYFETGLLDWKDLRRPNRDVFLRANAWVEVEGADATCFQGVSLGKQFIAETALAHLALVRISAAVEWFIGCFAPQEILLFDIRIDEFDPEPETKRVFADELRRRFGCTVVERVAGRDVSSPSEMYGRVHRKLNQGTWLEAVRRGYAIAADAAFRLRDLVFFPRTPRILVLPTGAMSRGLAGNASRYGVQPMMVAETTPKRVRFLMACLGSGVTLRRMGKARLARSERAEVDDIIACLEETWQRRSDLVTELMRSHLRVSVFATGRLHAMAQEAKGIRRFLARTRPRRLVVSSVRNQRIFCDVARTLGIPSDFILHSVNFSDFKYEAFWDPHEAAPVPSRILAWGEHNKQWVDENGARVPVVKTGHPGYSEVTIPGPLNNQRDANVLVLPYHWLPSDYTVLSADCYENLIHVVATLEWMGFRSIRIKLHPGVRLVEKFRRAVSYFGAAAEVTQKGNLADHADWADFAVGTAWTSGCLDVTTRGKPYIPFLLPRSVANARLVSSLRVVRTVEEMQAAIDAPDDDQDWAAYFDHFISYPEIRDSSARTWRAVAEAVGADTAA